MKLVDIILEEKPKGFTTKQTDYDAVTGQYSWDVDYTPLISIDKELESIYGDFKDAVKKYPTDQKLERLFNEFSSFKKQLRTHISLKYGR